MGSNIVIRLEIPAEMLGYNEAIVVAAKCPVVLDDLDVGIMGSVGGVLLGTSEGGLLETVG